MSWRKRHHVLFLLIAAGVLGAAFTVTDVRQERQMILLVVGVALLGVPHGALDPVVAIGASLANNGRDITRALVTYTALALLTFVLWWLAPTVAFIMFLLMSAFHFAVDWAGRELNLIQSLCVSSLILCGPASFWPEEMLSISSVLVPEASATPLVSILALAGVPMAAVVVWVSASKVRDAPTAGFELLAILLLAWRLRLLCSSSSISVHCTVHDVYLKP